MLDAVILTQTPPLYSCYGRNGQPVQVPITGQRAKRILHGALNIKSGEVALLISQEELSWIASIYGRPETFNLPCLFEQKSWYNYAT